MQTTQDPRIVPDCTLTTACFCLHDKNKHSLSVAQITESIETLMQCPVYLVIYCDDTMYPIIKKLRTPYDHLTVYHVIQLSDMWTFQYEDQVNRNRAIAWPSRDLRTGTESHLLTCNKSNFVLETIQANPFQTSKFGWMDCFIGKNMSKIAENYTPNMLPQILSNITDKFHIQILNVNDKKYKQSENIQEYYQQYRYVVCGGMFTCGREIGLKILQRVREIFVTTTEAGWGHGEEMLYLEILDEFYDDIQRGYGDYGQIINNFLQPTRNIHYIHHLILRRYFNFGYHRECYDCGNTLLREIKSHRLHVDAYNHFQIAFMTYVATFYHKHGEAAAAAQYLLDICQVHPALKEQWNTNPAFYRAQLSHAVRVPEGF